MTETDTIDAELMLTPSEARSLTAEIRTNLQRDWELIKRAYTERAWQVMGYASWDSYCGKEFHAALLRLPREERGATVLSLRDHGLSVRAIASATGLGKSTVQRELSPVPNGTPVGLTSQAPGKTPRVAEALVKAQSGVDDLSPLHDLDKRPPAPKPERVPAQKKYAHVAAPADVIQVDEWDYDYHLNNDNDDAARFIVARMWDVTLDVAVLGIQDHSGAVGWHVEIENHIELQTPHEIRAMAQMLLEVADELERRQDD